MLDKKRSSDIEAIRRLQFNAMKMAAGLPPQMAPVAPPTRHHPYMHARQQLHQPTAQQAPIEYCKEEPSAEVTEIDSGCESPQEQASPMVIFIPYFDIKNCRWSCVGLPLKLNYATQSILFNFVT